MTEAQFIEIVKDNAEVSAKLANELDNINERLGKLENVAITSDGRLAQLVELEQRRDRREEALAKSEIQERRERGTWLRSIASKEVAIPLVSAIGSAILTWAGISASHETPVLPPSRPTSVLSAPNDIIEQ